ncbi:MAG: CRTAC1 family protein [Pyrinomonadaceae bacterium]
MSAQSGPGLLTPKSSRGCAVGDFDNDGDMDALVMNMNEPPLLLRNEHNNRAATTNWLKVKLIGTKSNRSAIGARVRVTTANARTQTQEVTSQSSYYSHNDLRLHFGMGPAKKADAIEIRWPNGQTEIVKEIGGNQTIVIKEGAGVVR